MARLALVPWWAGLGIAVLSHALLHRLATGSQIPRSVWQELAMAGQYVLPALCLAVAVLSALHSDRTGSPDDGASRDVDKVLQGVTAQSFALQVAEGFRRRGYAVHRCEEGGAAGAADWVVVRQGERSLVQCAHWKDSEVDEPVVRALHAAMAQQSAQGGFVVTAGRFTQQTIAFASGRKIRLIDGAALVQLLRETGDTTRARSSAAKR